MAEATTTLGENHRRSIAAAAGLLFAIGIAGVPARADSITVDGDEWIVGEEEARLCSRALTECTPIFGKLAFEKREAALREKRLREKLRAVRTKREAEAAEIESLRETNARLEAENARMRESISWWLTSPLRWLRELFDADST